MIIVGPFQLKMAYDSVILCDFQQCNTAQEATEGTDVTTGAWKQAPVLGVLDCGRLQKYGNLFGIRQEADILHFVPVLSCFQKKACLNSQHPCYILCCCEQIGKGKPEGGIWDKTF